MTHWFIRWWFCLMEYIWSNLKLVRFSLVPSSKSLSLVSWPEACDCARTLFGPQPLSCSVKPRIRCDRPVGLTQSAVLSSPPDSNRRSPRHPFPSFYYSLSPPSRRSTSSFNTPASPDTETYSSEGMSLSRNTVCFSPEHRRLTPILNRRRQEQRD